MLGDRLHVLEELVSNVKEMMRLNDTQIELLKPLREPKAAMGDDIPELVEEDDLKERMPLRKPKAASAHDSDDDELPELIDMSDREYSESEEYSGSDSDSSDSDSSDSDSSDSDSSDSDGPPPLISE